MCAGIDVTKDNGTADLQELLPPQHIDLLVIAAGAQQLDHAQNVTRKGIREQFEVNALGPLFAVLELRSRLQSGSKVSAGCTHTSICLHVPGRVDLRAVRYGHPQ